MGSTLYKNGDKYKGNFKDGRPSGFGIMQYLSSIPATNGCDHENATYKGMWKSGKREGQGTMKWTDGSTFVGYWKNDLRDNGEMKFVNGTIY